VVAPAMQFPQQEWLFMPSRHDDDPGILARILFRLRQESGMTQEEVAEAAGWARDNTAISKLERGRTKLPSKDKIADLERAFGKEPGYIEDQLPRREKQMLAPSPNNVTRFPSTRATRLYQHGLEIEELDPSGAAAEDVEIYMMTTKRRLREELREAEGQKDGKPGANAIEA
jgi:transcriptional regulator with XRE-family HTH domain